MSFGVCVVNDVFENSLLSLMGWQAFSPHEQSRTVRLLMSPSFDSPCCLIMEDHGSAIDVSLIILRDPDTRLVYDVFLASRRDENTARAMALPKMSCWEDIAELTPSQADQVRGLYATAHPTTLQDVPLGGLDGITIRMWSWGPEGEHSIRMWSPEPTRQSAHHLWIITLIDLAHDCFTDPYALAYLESLRRYLAE